MALDAIQQIKMTVTLKVTDILFVDDSIQPGHSPRRFPGAANTTVQHVWKKDGAKVWAANRKIKGNKWTTASRRQLKAGSYSVDVVTADGTVLGSVAVTVK